MLAPADLSIRRVDDDDGRSLALVECPGLASDRERIDGLDPPLAGLAIDSSFESGRHENAQQVAGGRPLTAPLLDESGIGFGSNLVGHNFGLDVRGRHS